MDVCIRAEHLPVSAAKVIVEWPAALVLKPRVSGRPWLSLLQTKLVARPHACMRYTVSIESLMKGRTPQMRRQPLLTLCRRSLLGHLRGQSLNHILVQLHARFLALGHHLASGRACPETAGSSDRREDPGGSQRRKRVPIGGVVVKRTRRLVIGAR
jgi:hypothetical protein